MCMPQQLLLANHSVALLIYPGSGLALSQCKQWRGYSSMNNCNWGFIVSLQQTRESSSSGSADLYQLNRVVFQYLLKGYKEIYKAIQMIHRDTNNTKRDTKDIMRDTKRYKGYKEIQRESKRVNEYKESYKESYRGIQKMQKEIQKRQREIQRIQREIQKDTTKDTKGNTKDSKR